MIEELWENYKKYILIGGGVLLVIMVVFLFMRKSNSQASSNSALMNGADESSTPTTISSAASSTDTTVTASSSAVSSSTSEYIYVDVKGAVKHPGIFKVKSSMRVDDAINLAGGMQKTADRKHINLAQRLTDQQVVYVPIRGEIKGSATGTVDAEMAPSTTSDSTGEQASTTDSSTSSAADGTSGSGTVNLNTATKEQLQTLTNIGEKKADQIIQYREAHGKFKSVDELKEVQGIGDKTFEALKPQLSV